jgi:lysophospholipase L1-like esterase
MMSNPPASRDRISPPRRRVRALTAALLTASGLLLSTAIAAPASAAVTELEYAAIGDSFAAGVGARNYLDSSCYRSSKSYPRLLDADANRRLVAFPACTGSSTAEVIALQVPAIPSTAQVVTVTVGGNDVGFSSVMQNCFVFVRTSCLSHIQNGAAVAASSAFAESIRNVVAQVKLKAPGAKVIVTGYPLLFHLNSSGVNRKYKWADEVNAETVKLNNVIEANAVAAGATFVDVEPAFAGRGIGSSSPWINDWSWLRPVDGFHPNAAGYVAYANALRTVPVP